jgi:proteasome lid subunit RPN8/RPN11
MKNPIQPTISLPPRRREPTLVFSPLAWLKLQLFLHAGETEIGGFGLSAAENPLYVEDFQTVKQKVSMATVEFDDDAVADYLDQCVDRGIEPQRCLRIWLHSHPGESPEPSLTDERTFQRVFGGCDWSVMFILARSGRSYARLAFSAGPGGQVLIPVQVDWESWPQLLLEQSEQLPQLLESWLDEYGQTIHPARPEVRPDKPRLAAAHASPEEVFWDYQDYYDLGDEDLVPAGEGMPGEVGL